MNKFYGLVLSILVLLLTPVRASASSSFDTQYNIVYDISANGSGVVTQEVHITNQEAHSFASKYSIIVKGKPPKNINAANDNGNLPVFTSRIGNDNYEITINLTENVVGVGKSQKFKLEYELDNLAVKNGKVWNINIPRTDTGIEIDELNISISVPQSFGKPNYVSPPVSESQISNGKLLLKFTDIEVGAISAVFGEFQVYDLKLQYHLKNSNSQSEIQKVVFPPDTPYQRIYVESVEPLPLNVITDEDGNWIATYLLKPQEKIDINFTGQAHVYASAQSFPVFYPDPEKYLSPTEMWPVYDPEIQELAKTLKTPRNIYNYVVETLEYDYEKTKDISSRMGGKASLENPNKAACQEFTDLFVSLARAAGIPTREINGFGFTNNPKLRPISEVNDILHSWPEYYDSEKKIWVQIDPTWADTTGGHNYFDKLDTEHVAFVIHGLDSHLPRGAGDYKLDNSHQKDIEVTLGELKEIKPNAINVAFKLPFSLWPIASGRGELIIHNDSQLALYNLDPALSSGQLIFETEKTHIQVLPPLGKLIFNPGMKLKKFGPVSPPQLTLKIKNQEFFYSLPILNYYISILLIPATAIFILTMSIVVLSKYVYYKKNKRRL